MSDPSTSDQHLWYLEATDVDSYYRLHTRAKGNGQSLDVDPDDDTTVLFAASGRYAGQLWRLDPVDNDAFALSNNWTGPNKHLDTYRETLQPYLAEAYANGQDLTFSKYASSTTSSGISTSSNVSNAAASASASAAALADSSSKDSGLSTGAIDGAAIGGVVGLALIIGAIFFWMRRNRRQRTTKVISGSELPSSEFSEKEGSDTYAHVLPASHQSYQQTAELGTNRQPVELGTHQKPLELNTSQEPVELPSGNVR